MKIELLYPGVANLYGDLMNVRYMAQCTGAEVVETGIKDTPHFTYEDIDLVYMGCTTEKGQSLIRDAFRPYVDALDQRIDEGGVTLVTGNALEIFGQRIDNEDGSSEEMLGLYNTYARRRMMNRYNSLYLGMLTDFEIIGFKSQFSHSYGEMPTPLFETIRGAGLNPDVTGEGIRINNFMATYVEGPILIINPLFNKYVQKLMGIEVPVLAYEKAAMDVYKTRLAEFKEPTRGFIY